MKVSITCRVCFDDCFDSDERFDDEEPLVCPCSRSPDEFKDCCDLVIVVWKLGLRQSQIYLYVNVGVIIIC